jgi:hypothetical protein
MTNFVTWLQTLDAERLHDILTERPDAAVHFDDPLELAYALQSERSVRLAADRLSLAELQTLEAALALGARATAETLTSLLADSGPQHQEVVASTVSTLLRNGLVWLDDGRLRVVDGVTGLFPHPLDADAPLATMLAALSVTELRRVMAAHGHPRSVDPRPAMEATLLTHLSDPDWLRRHVTAAEPQICEPILALAKGGSTPPDPAEFTDPADGLDRDYDEIRYGASYLGSHWDRPATRREVFAHHPMAVEWAREHGIVFTSRPRYGYGEATLQMPAEVALALRGSGYRAPFTPVSPEAVVDTVAPAAVEASAGFAAAEFAQQAGAVLDTLARCPWPLVKSGGVALRELDRLAAAAVVTPSAARLALELADHAGLLMRTGGRLQISPAFEQWRAGEAAERYAELVAAWWDLPFAPSGTSTHRRKTVRPLERPALCDPCDPSRHSLVQAMAALPAGSATALAPLEATLRWRQPRIQLPVANAGSGWALAWSEAETLGVLAAGALSALGRSLLLATEPADLVPVIAALVPPNTDTAALGSDLTAVVLGSPSDRLRLLLDSVADRDASGSAVSWRFTPKSVRRALDDGADVTVLQAHLESVAGKELPQALRFLLHDVARRHGELRLSAQGTLIRGLDEPRVAEVLADSSLRGLGLRQLAPTILTTRTSVDDTLTALRRAGYYPIPEGNAGEWLDLADAG